MTERAAQADASLGGWRVGSSVAVSIEKRAALDELDAEAQVLSDRISGVLLPQWAQAPITQEQFAQINRSRGREVHWAFVHATGGKFWAVDEISNRVDTSNAAAAVFFPELHVRLIGWWLVHAWRIADLLQDTMGAIRQWRMTVAPVLARALVEAVGCVLYESRLLAKAWTTLKTRDDPVLPSQVRAALSDKLYFLQFGTRNPRHARLGESFKATNVYTYVDKLARIDAVQSARGWYDDLSDAAHPALGSRSALATDVLVPDHEAFVRWFVAREVVTTGSAADLSALHSGIADVCVDAVLGCGRIGLDVLDDALMVVDDFGLTTGSADLTNREYWRKLSPATGNRACPCGRGKWRDCRHWWTGHAPTIRY